MRFFISFIFLTATYLFAQNTNIDVTNYKLNISLNDTANIIEVDEEVSVKIKSVSDSIWLDLYGIDPDGFGMIINKEKGVYQDSSRIEYSQSNNRIYFKCNNIEDNASIILKFSYSGIPKTGMIISKNKFGERTFFGDNWPDRAHHWIACNDHPSDKATIQFTVLAPDHYDCIATGLLTKRTAHGNIIKSEFHSKDLLPTKVMVIGLAQFYQKIVNLDVTTIESFVYVKDSVTITDLDCADPIYDFYSSYIAEYPFEKLYNVQSTTQFGGMENAGNIFYDEGAFKGKGTMEALVAHEIAHQWFGNSASESDWPHLWLSEGFATYFTDIYWKYRFGTEAFNERLINERTRVIKFYRSYKHPVIDTTYNSLMDLLNPNSYQKGAWVLHMFHEKVGDESFQKVIRTYYNKFKYSNASSNDFIKIASEVTKEDQYNFFDQWLNRSGQPKLKVDFYTKKRKHELKIEQTQDDEAFKFPLEVQLNYTDGTSDTITLDVQSKCYVHKFCTDKKIKDFEVDPNVKLLYELQKKSLH